MTTANRLRTNAAICAAMAVQAVFSASAHATVTISSAATQNITCTGGVCTPTATNAVLNAGDLETMLAVGNTTITTTGSGGVQAGDIDVAAGIAWTSSSILTLDAWHSVLVAQPVAVNGTSGLSVLTNDGGTGGIFSFAPGANVSFLDLASTLSINGAVYTLENSIATLASAIASNASGNYALANNYDASHDGTYKNAAVATEFGGSFEGLGNSISNLSIKGASNLKYVGFFARVGVGKQAGGAVADIILQNVNIAGKGFQVGGLVGINTGTISGSYASGAVSSDFDHQGPSIGLLVGNSSGAITRSGAAGTITTGRKSEATAGGLVGSNVGTISQSFADCEISTAPSSDAGGLVGANIGPISQSYALGSIANGEKSTRGGLVGVNDEESTIAQAYSTTALNAINDSITGGLIGDDYSPAGSNTSTYWDITTSGVKNKTQGAGNIRNDPGITGLTTTQLQAGLPAGFDPTVWAQSPSINSGLPYLIANPPR